MKNYLLSLKPFIFLSLFFFFLSFLNGYFLAERYFQGEEIEMIRNIFDVSFNNSIELFFIIFVNNTVALFTSIFLGIIFGFFPLLTIFVNGNILGLLTSYHIREGLLLFLIIGILPHGIIELPLLIISSAMGLKIGRASIDCLIKKENNLKKEILKAFSFFSIILLPLTLIAALIETFITKGLLEIII